VCATDEGGTVRSSDNRRRPGILTPVLGIHAYRDRGLGEYEFLAGQARDKLELGTAQRELGWPSARRSAPCRQLVGGAGEARAAVLAVHR
jgi:hypothetical protein